MNPKLQRLRKKSKNRCFYCKKRTSIEESSVDHVTPKSKGGTATKENEVFSCKTCNKNKADMSLAMFLIWRTKKRFAPKWFRNNRKTECTIRIKCGECGVELQPEYEHCFSDYGLYLCYCEACCPGKINGDQCLVCEGEKLTLKAVRFGRR